MAYRMDILGATGIGMRVLLVLKNEKCPNHNTHSEIDMVEFYDLRYDHTPDGQFIAAFFLDDLNDIRYTGKGLILLGSEREWQIDDRTKGMVIDWAGYILYKTLEEIGCLPVKDTHE